MQVRSQLEVLLAEKAALAQENERLSHESCGLQELLQYSMQARIRVVPSRWLPKRCTSIGVAGCINKSALLPDRLESAGLGFLNATRGAIACYRVPQTRRDIAVFVPFPGGFSTV